MKYELSESMINNLIVFLNKVSYVGLKEVTAVNEIIAALNSPIAEEKTE